MQVLSEQLGHRAVKATAAQPILSPSLRRTLGVSLVEQPNRLLRGLTPF